MVISLWFWGLLACPELYCDWSPRNKHSWNFSGVHGFPSFTVIHVRFTVIEGNDFRDFGRWPRNRVWPLNRSSLNTGLTVTLRLMPYRWSSSIDCSLVFYQNILSKLRKNNTFLTFSVSVFPVSFRDKKNNTGSNLSETRHIFTYTHQLKSWRNDSFCWGSWSFLNDNFGDNYMLKCFIFYTLPRRCLVIKGYRSTPFTLPY